MPITPTSAKRTYLITVPMAVNQENYTIKIIKNYPTNKLNCYASMMISVPASTTATFNLYDEDGNLVDSESVINSDTSVGYNYIKTITVDCDKGYYYTQTNGAYHGLILHVRHKNSVSDARILYIKTLINKSVDNGYSGSNTFAIGRIYITQKNEYTENTFGSAIVGNVYDVFIYGYIDSYVYGSSFTQKAGYVIRMWDGYIIFQEGE